MARTSDLAIDSLLEHGSWVRTLARQLVRDPDDADDLAQETMLAALQADPVEIRSPRAWLGRVLRNVLWERVRGDQRRKRREVVATAARVEAEPSSAELVERVDAHRAVVNAVMAMPEHYRLVLLRRFFLDESPTVIARTLDMPVATVKTRLQRGLEQLRGQLDERYGGAALRRRALLPLVTLVPAGPAVEAAAPRASATGVGFAFAAATVVVVGLAAIVWTTSPWRGRIAPAEVTQAAGRPAATGMGAPLAGSPDPAVADRVAAGVQAATGVDWGTIKMPARTLAGQALFVDGTPAAGVVLRFLPDRDRGRSTAIALSDAAGAFELTAAGRGTVAAASADVVTVLAAVAGTAAVRADLVVVIARSHDLRGRVLDPTRRPLAFAEVALELPATLRSRFGARVAAARSERFVATTTAAGRFDLGGVPTIPGARVVVQREGYRPVRAELPVTDTCEVVLQPEPVPAGAILGTVLDHGGGPAADARIACGAVTTRTDRSGRFWLPGDVAGERVIAVLPERLPASIPLPREPAHRRDLVLQLGPAPRTIRGHVVDGSGRPVEWACVWVADPTLLSFSQGSCYQLALSGIGERATATGRQPDSRRPELVEDLLVGSGVPWRPAITDASGAFELTGLLARDYVVRAGYERTLQRSAPTTIAAGREGVRLVLADAAHERIRGRVVDGLGRPLARVAVALELSICELQAAGASVFCQSYRQGAMVTGPDGEFFLYDVPVGDLRLHLARSGYVARTIALGDASPGGLEVELTREHTLAVRVVEPNAVDHIAVLDAAGRLLVVVIPRGDEEQRTDRVPVHGDRTEAFRLPATAKSVVGYRGGRVVRRADVPPGGGELTL